MTRWLKTSSRGSTTVDDHVLPSWLGSGGYSGLFGCQSQKITEPLTPRGARWMWAWVMFASPDCSTLTSTRSPLLLTSTVARQVPGTVGHVGGFSWAASQVATNVSKSALLSQATR